MADWHDRGGGRGNRPQAGTITGGPGKGGGRAGSQPSLDIQGGAGKGGGYLGSQPSLDISGGPGKGGGRLGSQPRIEYGGSTTPRTSASLSDATTDARAQTSIGENGGANAENNPRVADPEGSYYFSLQVQDSGGQTRELAQFKEVSGLKSSTTVFELEEGGMNHRVHKLPGQSRWDNLVLKQGVCSDTLLLEWRQEILNDEFAKRRNGTVVMMTSAGEAVRRYSFVQGWPVSWEGPAFNADGSDLAVETLEIAHSGIQVT